MTTRDVGIAGEQLVALEFTRRGAEVFLAAGLYSVGMIARVDGRNYTVQVKAASEGGSVRFWLRPRGHKAYPPGEVDLFAVVSVEADRVMLIPAADVDGKVTVTADFNDPCSAWAFDRVFDALRQGGKE